jgi:hypothetical protein
VKASRLAGHGLPYEGRALDEHRPIGRGLWGSHRPGFWSSSLPVGRTRCECGEWSPVLPTTAARKRWHREHKDEIRSAS